MTPPVLAALILGRPLILCTAALDDSLGALLAQVNEEGKENALYYLSRHLIPAEVCYPPIEKHGLTLIFVAQKLRHYMLWHKVSLISRVNPLQYIMTRATLAGRLARWSMVLLQFDITFVPLRTIKGQILADFLTEHPLPAESPLNDDLPDEQVLNVESPLEQRWEMYFDGAASATRVQGSHKVIPGKAGIGLVFVTPERGMMRYSYHLSDSCTSNEAEYEALIAGLELTILMGITDVNIYGDSQLIIQQITGQYKILKPRLEEYYKYAIKLLEQIPNVTLYRIPRGDNSHADTLAKLAKELACSLPDSINIVVTGRQVLSRIDIGRLYEAEEKDSIIATTAAEDAEDWRQPFVRYL
ncbi:uncharacterized protein LOC110039042 [Phalaenopsis equestris]|uniref:uncharacterized protein LOC110039042 n=1 Tax=Phalaenopsis equestris TaxID=78828 RepID=UPI0009E46855|nr:uncharacterized protein LOC110039042 [Phalaenopsis equestris]